MQSTKTSSTTTTIAATMNSSNQLKAAVENIQDELQRILAVADLQRIEASVASEEFKTRLIGEFNLKLRGFKSKVRALNEENGRLRKRIAELERELPQLSTKRRRSHHNEENETPNQDYIAIWERASGQRPKEVGSKKRVLSTINLVANAQEGRGSRDVGKDMKDRDTRDTRDTRDISAHSQDRGCDELREPGVQIFSSPLKSPLKSPCKQARDLTSSQFNRLPTQYSDELRDTAGSGGLSVKPDLPPRAPDQLGLSPIVVAFAESQEVVEDSQDEIEPLAQVPPHYTSLQRAQFLRNYFRMKLADNGFCVSLSSNPITERAWVTDDFKRNPRWVPPAVAPSRARPKTKAQEAVYREFFREAGFGAPAAGPKWGDSDGEEDDAAHDDIDGARSQVMDKYLSPPGYMVGLFPTTQEALERKAEIQQKASNRLERRLASAVAGDGEFIFYENVLNTYVAQGRYKLEAV